MFSSLVAERPKRKIKKKAFFDQIQEDPVRQQPHTTKSHKKSRKPGAFRSRKHNNTDASGILSQEHKNRQETKKSKYTGRTEIESTKNHIRDALVPSYKPIAPKTHSLIDDMETATKDFTFEIGNVYANQSTLNNSRTIVSSFPTTMKDAQTENWNSFVTKTMPSSHVSHDYNRMESLRLALAKHNNYSDHMTPPKIFRPTATAGITSNITFETICNPQGSKLDESKAATASATYLFEPKPLLFKKSGSPRVIIEAKPEVIGKYESVGISRVIVEPVTGSQDIIENTLESTSERATNNIIKTKVESTPAFTRNSESFEEPITAIAMKMKNSRDIIKIKSLLNDNSNEITQLSPFNDKNISKSFTSSGNIASDHNNNHINENISYCSGQLSHIITTRRSPNDSIFGDTLSELSTVKSYSDSSQINSPINLQSQSPTSLKRDESYLSMDLDDVSSLSPASPHTEDKSPLRYCPSSIITLPLLENSDPSSKTNAEPELELPASNLSPSSNYSSFPKVNLSPHADDCNCEKCIEFGGLDALGDLPDEGTLEPAYVLEDDELERIREPKLELPANHKELGNEEVMPYIISLCKRYWLHKTLAILIRLGHAKLSDEDLVRLKGVRRHLKGPIPQLNLEQIFHQEMKERCDSERARLERAGLWTQADSKDVEGPNSPESGSMYEFLPEIEYEADIELNDADDEYDALDNISGYVDPESMRLPSYLQNEGRILSSKRTFGSNQESLSNISRYGQSPDANDRRGYRSFDYFDDSSEFDEFMDCEDSGLKDNFDTVGMGGNIGNRGLNLLASHSMDLQNADDHLN
ncbi:hypothetical protein G9A89_019950 [Geosiphon pyriformis]|nr:hypothetical protein G9A89_019950 [Geosiphon pyriformis]